MVPQLLLALLPVLTIGAPTGRQMIDMTHAMVDNGKMPSFPGHTPYNFTINVRGPYKLLDDIYVELNTIRLSEHTATHVDAPAHFGKGKSRIHQIPDQDLIGPGAVIDIREKAKTDKDAEVLLEDVLKYEKKYGRIPDRAFVFCNSGMEKKWMDKKAFFGTEHVNVATEIHSPGFSLEAVKFLVEKRDIIGIGGDGVSFERGTRTYPVHRYLLDEKSRVGFEMVANLDKVPPAGATIYAFPMKIYDGSGAPVRMFAINGGFGLEASVLLTTSLMSIVVLNLWYLF